MEKETLLEKYIQGELTEKEREEFDALLKEDADFKGEFEFRTNLRRVAEAEDDAVFKAILSDFESEARMAKPTTNRFPVKWLVAASIALIAGLTYFLTLDTTTSTQELFAENFEPYSNVVHPIVRGEEGQNKKTSAFAAYQTGDYETALPLFDELYANTKEPYYLFYKANALIELNRAKEAVPLLQEHIRTNDTLVKNSSWYLAMAYLQLDDKVKVKKMLQEVINNGAYKVDEAQKLMDALE